MSGILSELSRQECWEIFLSDRLMKGRFSWISFQEADSFVGTEQFRELAQRIIKEGPGIPEKKLINKMGTGKKRAVYTYGPDQMRMLKFIAFSLYRYDRRLPANCYSFRRNKTARDAVKYLVSSLNGRQMWAYKTDIHDYFNSVSIPILLPILKDFLEDDSELYCFFDRMLSDSRVLIDGEVVQEQHGIMAGTPTAPFLADLYLAEVDRYYSDRGVLYARYSDDIIFFAQDLDSLNDLRGVLTDFLERYGLTVNPDKEHVYKPGEAFDFLGFKCLGANIDLADATREKMKGKIRRKTRSLMRARGFRGVDAETAMSRLIRHFNVKFFEDDETESLNWSRYFFPLINRTEGLKEIDRYLQQNLRYLATGRHGNSGYRIRYETLKNLGYRSLVHEYYASDHIY